MKCCRTLLLQRVSAWNVQWMEWNGSNWAWSCLLHRGICFYLFHFPFSLFVDIVNAALCKVLNILTPPPPLPLRFSISEFFSNQEKHGDCLKHQFYKTQSTSNVLATICLSYCHPLGKSPYAFPPHTIKPFHIHSSTHFQLKELTVVTNWDFKDTNYFIDSILLVETKCSITISYHPRMEQSESALMYSFSFQTVYKVSINNNLKPIPYWFFIPCTWCEQVAHKP